MENLEKIKKELLEYGASIPIDEALEIVARCFSAGRLQGISDAEDVVPEKTTMYLEDMYQAVEAYNICRQQTLDNLAKLKGKE